MSKVSATTKSNRIPRVGYDGNKKAQHRRQDQGRQSTKKERGTAKMLSVNATYKLDAKIESQNDPFKSSNEIKRTFYVSDSESRHIN